jgi:hypothetical protein
MIHHRRIETAVCAALLLAMSSFAGYVSGGAFVGYYTPVLQPEARSGIVFGVSSRIKIFETLYAEPYFFQIQERGEEVASGDMTTTCRGVSISSVGGNLIIGTWLTELARPYALVGIGLAAVESHSGDARSNRLCSNWGAGVEYTLIHSRLFLDISARLLMIREDDESYLKSILINGGLNWYFKWNP